MDDHLTRLCGEVAVTCNTGCGASFKRREIKQHESESCPFGILTCEFKPHGCNHTFLRMEYDDHLRTSTTSHLTLLTRSMKAQSDEIVQLKTKLQELEYRDKNPLRTLQQKVCGAVCEGISQVDQPTVNCLAEKWRQFKDRWGLSGCHLMCIVALWAFLNCVPLVFKVLALFFCIVRVHNEYYFHKDHAGFPPYRQHVKWTVIMAALSLAIIHPVRLLLSILW